MRKLLFTIGLLGALGGCANITAVPAGTPVAEILQKFGQPIADCPRQDGGKRLVWTTQPSGQFAFGADINKAGALVAPVQQVLTDAQFDALGQGKWTQQQVLCQFGPPSNIEGVAKNNETVWAYRYKQSGVWPSMMFVYFDSKGEAVTHFHPGPDPWSLGGGDRVH